MAIKKLLKSNNKLAKLERQYKMYSEGALFNREKRDRVEAQIEAEKRRNDHLMTKVTEKEYEEHLECGYGLTYKEFIS